MKKSFTNSKTLIAEIVGMCGGFFWAKSTNWDYEPLILFTISSLSFMITLSFLFFDNKDLQQHQNISKPHVQDKVNTVDNLDAKKIQDEIANSAPFLRQQIENNYTGVKIKWLVSFDSIRQKHDTVYHVTALYKGNYPWVYFDVDLREYPIFKVANKNKFFLVSGTIINVGGNTFTIEVEEMVGRD